MGYTHYWYRKVDLSDNWDKFLSDVKFVVEKLPEQSESAGSCYSGNPLIICGWDGTGEPIFNEDEISFNGNAPELDHETFSFPRIFEPPE